MFLLFFKCNFIPYSSAKSHFSVVYIYIYILTHKCINYLTLVHSCTIIYVHSNNVINTNMVRAFQKPICSHIEANCQLWDGAFLAPGA